jgi:hypothetical protein
MHCTAEPLSTRGPLPIRPGHTAPCTALHPALHPALHCTLPCTAPCPALHPAPCALHPELMLVQNRRRSHTAFLHITLHCTALHCDTAPSCSPIYTSSRSRDRRLGTRRLVSGQVRPGLQPCLLLLLARELVSNRNSWSFRRHSDCVSFTVIHALHWRQNRRRYKFASIDLGNLFKCETSRCLP